MNSTNNGHHERPLTVLIANSNISVKQRDPLDIDSITTDLMSVYTKKTVITLSCERLDFKHIHYLKKLLFSLHTRYNKQFRSQSLFSHSVDFTRDLLQF